MRVGSTPGPKPTAVEIRVMAKVIKNADGCWIYGGSIDVNGYGVIGVGSRIDGTRRRAKAHRALWEATRGPLLASLDLDHLCRVRSCVNPERLEPVSRRTNLLRGQTIPAANAAKLQCASGHDFSPDNTYIDRSTGARVCRRCKAIRAAARRAKGRVA